MESFKELRNFKPIRDAESELKFTGLLRHIYHRHRYEPAYNHPCWLPAKHENQVE